MSGVAIGQNKENMPTCSWWAANLYKNERFIETIKSQEKTFSQNLTLGYTRITNLFNKASRTYCSL